MSNQRESRQTGNSRYGHSHGNMPHQMQQQQYGTGSSGAQGMTGRAGRGTALGAQDNQYEESKQGHNPYMSGTGSGGGAVGGEAGSSTTASRRKRGYRQQNQQPSSGANDRETHRHKQNRQTNSNQDAGRGGINNGNSQSYDDQIQSSDQRGRP